MKLDQGFGHRTSVPAPPPTTGHVPSWRLQALVSEMPELDNIGARKKRKTLNVIKSMVPASIRTPMGVSSCLENARVRRNTAASSSFSIGVSTAAADTPHRKPSLARKRNKLIHDWKELKMIRATRAGARLLLHQGHCCFEPEELASPGLTQSSPAEWATLEDVSGFLKEGGSLRVCTRGARQDSSIPSHFQQLDSCHCTSFILSPLMPGAMKTFFLMFAAMILLAQIFSGNLASRKEGQTQGLCPVPQPSRAPPTLNNKTRAFLSLDCLATHSAICSTLQRRGYQHCKLDVIFQLEQGEELWIEGRGFFQSHSPGRESAFKEELLATQHISKKDTSTIIPMSSKLTYKLKLKLGYYLEKVFTTHKKQITVCMQYVDEVPVFFMQLSFHTAQLHSFQLPTTISCLHPHPGDNIHPAGWFLRHVTLADLVHSVIDTEWYQHCKLDVIFQLEQGEELWIEGRGFFQSHSPVLLEECPLYINSYVDVVRPKGIDDVTWLRNFQQGHATLEQPQVKCKDCGAFGHTARSLRCPMKRWQGMLVPLPLGSRFGIAQASKGRIEAPGKRCAQTPSLACEKPPKKPRLSSVQTPQESTPTADLGAFLNHPPPPSTAGRGRRVAARVSRETPAPGQRLDLQPPADRSPSRSVHAFSAAHPPPIIRVPAQPLRMLFLRDGEGCWSCRYTAPPSPRPAERPAPPAQSPSIDQEPEGRAVPGPRSVLHDDLQVSSSSEESDWDEDTSDN
ncbi:hypothetical protein E5288_WYG003705 [Bos mutus]|uniref:Zinc knuckle domain-containing protein n=1 Tax=Bos mutus TaxID=72004 RepID=A0A6B0SGH2_9CETA|nr:hypothetical protein [Bos mutus]